MVRPLAVLVGLSLALLAPGAGQAGNAVPPLRRASLQVDPPTTLGKTDALSLIRTTLVALNQANATGNYTVLRDLGSTEFQTANTASRLSDIFRPLRAQAFDLSGVTIIEPQLNEPPRVDKGQLHMTGYFPSVPLQIRFDIVFVGRDQRWVVNSLSVALASSALGPAAPDVAAHSP